jgi:hypothetical protein
VRARLAAGVENCVVLLRELRAQGYTGSYSILKEYVQPLRLRRAVKPGEQVDFGHFTFTTATGQRQWLWGFVMVLAWSRLYVEFIRRADDRSTGSCARAASAACGPQP